MTPADLSEYLRVLKEARVARADVVLGPDQRLVVEFSPDVPDAEPLTGEVPTPQGPGGWKTPLRLDDPSSLWPDEPGPKES